MNKKFNYYDVLLSFLPYYYQSESPNKCLSRKFANENNVKITGIYYYKPFNVTEVKKFHKIMGKLSTNYLVK